MNKIQFRTSATEVTVRMARSILKKGKTPLFVYDPILEIEYEIKDWNEFNNAEQRDCVFYINNK